MKSIRIFGLAVVAAVAAMAIVGAGSASATTLCKKNIGSEGECSAADRISLPVAISGFAAPLTFSAGEYEAKCEASDLTVEVEESLGAGKGLSGQVSSLPTFEGCELWGGGGVGCSGELGNGEPEVLNLPYHAEIHETTNGKGTLTLSSGGSGKPTLRFTKCGATHVGTCTYNAEKLELGFEGTASPKAILASNERFNEVKSESSNCNAPSILDLSASYEFLGPGFSASTSESGLNTKENEPLVVCGSEMEGSLSGAISGLSFSNCEGECQAAKALNLPYETSYTATGPKQGIIALSGLQFEFSSCALGSKCKFGATGALSLDVENGKIVAKNEPIKREYTGYYCGFFPEEAYWTATYSMNDPVAAVVAEP